jgi:hypothetical protein
MGRLQRLQHHAIEHAEDGAAPTDAQGERGDGGGGEGGCAQEAADGEAEVAEKVFHLCGR